MIVFKEKLYVAPVIAALSGKTAGAIMNTAMIGSVPIGIMQSHSQGKQAEEAAEEQARLQRKMNKELARIADSGDPGKGQQAAAVIQGQSSFTDVGEDLGNGVKKAGNIVGGTTGSVLGGATGTVAGAAGGALGAAALNKWGGTKIGKGKAGLIGAGVGMLGGSILGGQAGSSIFSERSFAVAGELVKAGKGLLKVAGQHKGTIGEGLAAGAVMAGAGYGMKKAIQSDEESGKTSGLKKAGLAAGGALLGAMALKKGANWGAFGKYGNIAKRGAGAAQTGIVFGAGMTALPEVFKRRQQGAMQQDTGDGQKKKSGMSTLGKVALTAGGLALAAKGGHMAASRGWLGDAGTRIAGNVSRKASQASTTMEKTKDSIVRKVGNAIGNDKLAEGRINYNATKGTIADPLNKYAAPKWSESKAGTVIDKVTGIAGAGSRKTQRFANQLQSTDSKILQSTGKFLKENPKTAMLATAPLGYAATVGTWQKGEDIVNKGLKKADPRAFKDEEQ